mgnify:CR=1 FL=1
MATRRKAKPQLHSDIAKSAKRYSRFTGHDAYNIGEINLPNPPKAVAVIGECAGILYDTVRDGKLEKYIHEFAKKDRPLFCVSPDGKQLLLVGGNFTFTERGIVDRSAPNG